MSETTKLDKRAPCRFETVNNLTGKPQMAYPSVNCNFDCGRCGWNPEVQARRIEALKARAVKP